MTTVAAQLYTLRNVMQTPEQIDKGFARLKQDGWQAVQASGLGPIGPTELRALADRHGLAICATHVSFDRLTNDLNGLLKDHEILDCKYMGLGGLPHNFAGSADGFREFAKLITPVAERIRDAGRAFVYHNHNFEFVRFGELTGMDILFAECGDAVQFELDTYWVQAGGGDVIQWLEKLSGRVEVVHFKDMVYDVDAGGSVMAEVGEGNLNWPGIISMCRRTGVLWHIVEQDECRRDPFDSLKISLGNLNALGLE